MPETISFPTSLTRFETGVVERQILGAAHNSCVARHRSYYSGRMDTQAIFYRRHELFGIVQGEETLVRLSDLVGEPRRRRPEPYSAGKLFISVLHVIGEGILDLSAVRSYQPITPGIPISPGEVLISRLNPRIPRVLVVPDLGAPMLCSSEFEVLRPKKNISPYAIAFLLMSRFCPGSGA